MHDAAPTPECEKSCIDSMISGAISDRYLGFLASGLRDYRPKPYYVSPAPSFLVLTAFTRTEF